MIKILASDGMEKSAIAALEAKGCQVDVHFYDPDALCEAVKDYDALTADESFPGWCDALYRPLLQAPWRSLNSEDSRA